MVEGTAKMRNSRTENTRSTIPAESLDPKPGDEVDIFRKAAKTDVSGWEGPATVIDATRAKRGVVTVRIHNRVTEVQLSDLRPHLVLFAFLAAP